MANNQAELFQAETTWFHVFRDMIESGDVAKIGPHATTVYLVVKAHTNFSTGRAFPALETIAEKSGVSLAQVKRCLATLEEFGYIKKAREGRRNLYTLREKVLISDEHGRPQAVATWDYIPDTVKHAVADLKNVLVTGELAGARIVNISHLQLNVNTGSGSPVQIIAGVDLAQQLETLPPELREKVMAAILANKRQADQGS